MLRLTPASPYAPLVSARSLDLRFAGAESNVAADLAFWGTPAKFVTSLPTNDLGQSAVNNLREFGVDTTAIVRKDGRIGTYYIEYGTSIRPSKVLYDRQYSAIARATVEDFDWDALFQELSHFFLSGITPALSESCAQLSLLALQKARQHGVATCFDLNFRRALWTAERARPVYTSFLPYINVMIGNAGSAADVFGIQGSSTSGAEQAESVARQLLDLHNGIRQVSMTIREQFSASHNLWKGITWDGQQLLTSPEFDLEVIERLGGGDAFAAGILHASYHQWEPQAALDFAVAASALKHTVPGDICTVSEQDILEAAEGKVAGYIKR